MGSNTEHKYSAYAPFASMGMIIWIWNFENLFFLEGKVNFFTIAFLYLGNERASLLWLVGWNTNLSHLSLTVYSIVWMMENPHIHQQFAHHAVGGWSKTRTFAPLTIMQYWLDNTIIIVFFSDNATIFYWMKETNSCFF